jgi:hypothetical protein
MRSTAAILSPRWSTEEGAGLHEFFCGLGMEIKGETIPTPGGGLDYTRPQPFGVVGRIIRSITRSRSPPEGSRPRSWPAIR